MIDRGRNFFVFFRKRIEETVQIIGGGKSFSLQEFGSDEIQIIEQAGLILIQLLDDLPDLLFDLDELLLKLVLQRGKIAMFRA
jgi:hypothetical protein